ncbi:MAG: hypothetical protein WCW25_00485 [Patescibacteria group bacterium]|jgi:hypothetical protein
MNEGEKILHTEKITNTEHPELLDLVIIDGKWAQVIHGGNTIKFLEDEKAHPINWDDYILVEKINKGLANFLEFDELAMNNFVTLKELENIYYDAETKASEGSKDILKLNVKVFGKYVKK